MNVNLNRWRFIKFYIQFLDHICINVIQDTTVEIFGRSGVRTHDSRLTCILNCIRAMLLPTELYDHDVPLLGQMIT
jgi:hypothetical protein